MTKIKICGITNLDDARMAVESGADALGFNFYESSPRYISPETANEIIGRLPHDAMHVGVFVNPSFAEIERTRTRTAIEYVQLHGDETSDFVRNLISGTSAKVIKALRVSPAFDTKRALEYEVEHFLLDTLSAQGFGGTGETFDWEFARRFREASHSFFLAGGLTPDNVADAIREVRPFGVDVCSGVESVAGKKDHKKVAAFIKNARNVQ